MKIRYILLVLPFLLALNCGGAVKESVSYEAADESSSGGDAGFSQEGDRVNSDSAENSGGDTVNAAVKTQKLIKSADISIEADPSLRDDEGKLLGVDQRVAELLGKYDAYIESSRWNNNYAYFKIRVPELFYNTFLSSVGVLGEVRSRNESAEDVTLKYYDLEGRLNTRKILLATFQDYLSRVQNIDEIMKVESRIAELQNEIDRLGTQFTQLANLINYATVELTIYSDRAYDPNTLGKQVAAFFASFSGIASGALVVLLGIIIYGGALVVLGLLFFWLLLGRVGLLRKAFRLVMKKSE
jgi:hypothetical protein